MVGVRTSGAEGPAGRGLAMSRRRAPIACDLPLKRAVDGSDRSKPEGAPARVDVKGIEGRDDLASMTNLVCWLSSFSSSAGEMARLHVIVAGSAPGAPVAVRGESELKGHPDRLTCAAGVLAVEPAT
jgi:hypothetical protein